MTYQSVLKTITTRISLPVDLQVMNGYLSQHDQLWVTDHGVVLESCELWVTDHGVTLESCGSRTTVLYFVHSKSTNSIVF